MQWLICASSSLCLATCTVWNAASGRHGVLLMRAMLGHPLMRVVLGC